MHCAQANPLVVARLMARLVELNASAVPVRFPEGVGSKCSPAHFNGTIQWWAK